MVCKKVHLGLCALAPALVRCPPTGADGPQQADLHGQWDTKVRLDGPDGLPDFDAR